MYVKKSPYSFLRNIIISQVETSDRSVRVCYIQPSSSCLNVVIEKGLGTGLLASFPSTMSLKVHCKPSLLALVSALLFSGVYTT